MKISICEYFLKIGSSTMHFNMINKQLTELDLRVLPVTEKKAFEIKCG